MLPLLCRFIAGIASFWTLLVPLYVLGLAALVLRLALGRYE